MQLVIDISKDAYDYIMGSGYFLSDFNMISEIRNGIPLDKIRTEIENLFPIGNDWDDYYLQCKNDVLKIINNYMGE